MKKGFVFTMYIMVLLILFSSCQNKTKNHVIQLVREWEGKEKKYNSLLILCLLFKGKTL